MVPVESNRQIYLIYNTVQVDLFLLLFHKVVWVTYMSLAEAIGNSVDLLGKEFKVLKSCKVHFGSVSQLQICNIFYNIISKINIVHTCFVFKHYLKDTNISNYFDILKNKTENMVVASKELRWPLINFHHRLRR